MRKKPETIKIIGFMLLLSLLGLGIWLENKGSVTPEEEKNPLQNSLLSPSIVAAETGDSLYKAQKTPFEAEFGKKEDPTKIIFRKDDSTLTFKLPYKNIKWEKRGDALIADIGNKVFSYKILKSEDDDPVGIKEEIILKSPTNENQFEFSLSLENLECRKSEQDGLWHFYNKEGKELFFIPPPYMEDGSGSQSQKVKIDIKENKLVITADKEWLQDIKRTYPIRIDPSLMLKVLTVHSHPQQGDDWVVEFETQGQADLKIIPEDQATIDDDEFKSLHCGDKEITPQILEGDVIYVPDWQCDNETATVVHYTKVAGDHTLRFEFGGLIAYAHNAAKLPIRFHNDFKLKGFVIKFLPTFCTVASDYDTYTTIYGEVVYCDADGDMWTETASSTYSWGPINNEPDDSCIGKGASYSACNYCENLIYAAYTDWRLPPCVATGDPTVCMLYQFGMDTCGWTGGGGTSCTPTWDTNAVAGSYWSSTEYNRPQARNVDFSAATMGLSSKSNSNNVRCVR